MKPSANFSADFADADAPAIVLQLFDYTPLHAALLDREFRYLAVSKSWLENVGMTFEQLRGKCHFEVLPNIKEHYRVALNRAFAGETIVFPKDSYLNYEGRTLWIQWDARPWYRADGSIGGVLIQAQSITEHVETAERMVLTEARLEAVLEAASEGLWDHDLRTGKVILSKRCFEHLGLPQREEGGTTEEWYALVHPEDRELHRRATAAHLSGETPVFFCELRVRHADGHYVWLSQRGRVVERDLQGRPVRMLGMQRDISARKNGEAELRRAKEEAQAASAAKSAFVANISHEIRTPLTAILGFIEVLQNPGLSAHERNEALAVLRRSGRHLSTLINDVLDFSKLEAGQASVETAPANPAAIVEEVSTLMQPRAQSKGLSFAVVNESPLPPLVRLDPLRTRQILMNLLDNAIKFTAAGKVQLVLRRSQDRLCFDVIDTGEGIPPAAQSRLFEPFVQADNSNTRRHGGTGLGLAISRRLARMMNGDIEMESEARRGSRFTFWLPVGPELATGGEPPVSPPDAVDAAALAGARILLVEDSLELQALISLVLRQKGATVETAGDGRQGVTLAREAQAGGSSFDLILMDVQMPVLDGYAATRELRAAGIAAPIVALTADSAQIDLAQLKRAGCDECFAKPIEIEAFLMMVWRNIRK